MVCLSWNHIGFDAYVCVAQPIVAHFKTNKRYQQHQSQQQHSNCCRNHMNLIVAASIHWIIKEQSDDELRWLGDVCWSNWIRSIVMMALIAIAWVKDKRRMTLTWIIIPFCKDGRVGWSTRHSYTKVLFYFRIFSSPSSMECAQIEWNQQATQHISSAVKLLVAA